MPDVIDDIKRKYKMSDRDAHVIYDASLHTGKNIHHIALLYQTLPQSGSASDMSRKLYNAIQSANIGKLEARRKLYGDDLRTKFVVNPFDTSGDKITLIDKESKTKTLITQPRHIHVSKRLQAITPQDEIYKEASRAKNVPPKYYYFDVDGKFNDRGYTEPPRYDPQFKGYHDYIPYARITVMRVISPSKYEVPQLDDAGNFIIDSQGQLIKARTPGYKQLFVEFFMLGKTVESFVVRVPYSYRAEADIIQSVETSRKIRDKIASLINKDIYTSLQPGRKKETLVEDLIKIKGHDGKEITLSQLTNGIEKEQREKELSQLKYLEYYGKPTEERKRKASKKPTKRKKVIKVKPKRKCICKPIIKRKKLSIKKKIIKRRK